MKSARKRLRAGRVLKERRLAVEPVDVALRPLCPGLVVSISATEGLMDYLGAVDAASGKMLPLTARGVAAGVVQAISVGG